MKTVGRPRRPETDEAILTAAVACLVEHGPARASLEDVASRAGVSRPTVYRRFPDRAALVESAVSHILDADLPVPRATGSPPDDLLALVMNTIQMLEATPIGGLFRAIISDMPHDRAMQKIANDVGARRRQRVLAVLRRAVAAGLMASDTDVNLVADGLLGPVYFRFIMTGRVLDRAYVAALIRQVCGMDVN